MYEQFFGFRERPFDLTPNPRYLVLTESHREALSNLVYGIASRKGITLLVGEAGSGKTTVIRTALEKQSNLVHCVHVHNPTLSRAEFVEMLANRFSLSAEAGKSKTVMLLELEALLRARHAAGETSVLIIDEAQSLPLDLLEEIRLLANIETNDEKLVSVIIAGQPEIVDRLNKDSLRQLKQRIALRCQLRPLTLAETAAYIAGRIRAAGGVDARVFTREAVALIHERAQGLPRTINVIADNALLGGLAANQRPVGSQLVREVCRDFDINAPVLPGAPRNGGLLEHVPMPSTRPLLLTPPAPQMLPAVAQPAEIVPAPVAAGAQVGRDAERPADGMFAGFQKRKRFSFFWD